MGKNFSLRDPSNIGASADRPTRFSRRHCTGLIVLLVLCIGITGPAAAQKPILFEQGEFQPSQQLGIETASETKIEKYGLIQFEDVPSEQQREKLRDKYGLKLLRYIPEDAWFARIPPEYIGQLKNDPKVSYIGNIPDNYKISSRLHDKDLSSSEKQNLKVVMFEDVDAQVASQKLQKYGKVEDSEQDGKIWTLKAPLNSIQGLSSEEIVQYIILDDRKAKTALDNSRSLIEVDTIQSSPYDLTGDGFTAALWDNGWAGNHSDLNYTNKMIRGDEGADCGNSCEVSSHATSVAGAMLGGGKVDNTYRGIAPDARGVTYELPTSSTDELYNETNHSLEYETVVSQNSWVWDIGYSDFGEYDEYTQAYDDIISDNSTDPDEALNIVFAAGNEGNEDHPSRYETIPGPGATAKNTVTVGAVRDDGSMTDFSSWGPVNDGRIKPDIVANGNSVTTTDPGNNYASASGTSIASPAISGLTVLVNQKFNQTHGRIPSPETTKNILISSATDMNRTGPDYIYGWGLANATKAVEYIEEDESKNLIRTGSVGHGETVEYSVDSQDIGVNITLVWSDYPGALSSSEHLVNDLDLVVKNSSGERYHPWTLNSSEPEKPATRDREDHTNNVEQVFVPSSESLTVTVEGHNVPRPEQNYSVVFTPTIEDENPPNITIHSPEEKTYTSQPDFNISASEEIHNAFVTAENTNHSLSEDSGYYTANDLGLDDGTHNITFWGNDTSGNIAQKWVEPTVDTNPPNIYPESPADNANLSDNFPVEATWNNSGSDIKEANYSIKNDSGTFLEDNLNDTVNIGQLEDGEYNVTYTAISDVDRETQKNRSITVDTQPPSVNIYMPESDYINGSFYVNGTWQDSSSIEQKNYTIRNSSGLQATVELNTSYNSLNLLDDSYDIGYNMTDYAGNTAENQSYEKVAVNNEPPSISPLKPIENENISGIVNINATVESKGAEINWTLYRLQNSTENLTNWRKMQDTDLNTTNYSDKEYNITFKVNDSAGLTKTEKTAVQIDNQVPEINLTEYNITETYNNWTKDNQTIQVACSDNRSGVNLTSVTGPVSKEMEGQENNFTITNSGDHSYEFRCHDRSGNVKSANKNLKIDPNDPEIQSSSPSNGSTTGLNPTFTVGINDEGQESGLNVSASNLDISKGSIDDISWSNSSIDIEVSGLNYSESYSITGELKDNVNHTHNTFLEFTTESDSSDSDSGGSSGGSGGGGSLTGDFSGTGSTSEEPEIITEDDRIEITNVDLSEEQQEFEISEIDMSIDRVSLGGSISTSESITFQKVEEPDVTRPNRTAVFSYLEIETNSSSDLVANITYEIEKSWFNISKDPEEISLYRMDNQWQKLDTEILENHSDHYQYKSQIPGFSTFAIAADRQAACQKREVHALNPDSDRCKVFTGCKPPEDWQKVENCTIENRKNAQNTIDLAEEKVSSEESHQKLEEAKEKFQNGNYTGSKQLAEEAIELEEQKENRSEILNTLVENKQAAVLVVILASLTFLVYYIIQIRKKQKLLESVEALKQVFRDPVIRSELDMMEKEIDAGNYDAATEETEEIIRRLRQKYNRNR